MSHSKGDGTLQGLYERKVSAMFQIRGGEVKAKTLVEGYRDH